MIENVSQVFVTHMCHFPAIQFTHYSGAKFELRLVSLLALEFYFTRA